MRSLRLYHNKEEAARHCSCDSSRRIVVDLDGLGRRACVDIDKASLEREYVELIASLGGQVRSIYWWATALAEKNAFSSELFARLFKIKYLAQAVKDSGERDVDIICDDPVLQRQVRKTYRAHLEKGRLLHDDLMAGCRWWIDGAAGVAKQCARTVSEWQRLLLVRRSFKMRKRQIAAKRDYVVLRTWADRRSYAKGRYDDPYFKDLLAHLGARNRNVLVFAGILGDPKDTIRRLADDGENLIIPTNAYLSVADIVRCLFISLFLRPRVKGGVDFSGNDVTELIRSELRNDILVTRFFGALLEYYSCRRLAASVPIERFIYTFENYAWEKMSLLGLRCGAQKIRTIGFQHAFIPRNNFAYFPGSGEWLTMPLPDVIVTMGERPGLIMRRFGAFPDGMFETGCALRQGYLDKLSRLPRRTSGNIFVPLTITVDDTVKVFRFLYASGLVGRKEKVYFRLHPATPLNKVMQRIGFDLPGNFIISDMSSMEDELARCGVVLYTSTTVCLEALKMGRPVIYLDVNYPDEVDPLFECPDLKRVVETPEDLLAAIESFFAMDSTAFEAECQRAQEYVRGYFAPVTEENMDAFLR